MQTLELKIPPLFLVVVAAVLMWIGAYSFRQLSFRFTHQPLVACGFALCGAFTCAIGIMEFNRAKTTVNPMKPQSASSLVRTGIYRRTRNPMYLGFLSLLLASAILTGNVAAFFVLPGFVIYMNRFQIKPEERALARLFGDEFESYCSQVRRWI